MKGAFSGRVLIAGMLRVGLVLTIIVVSGISVDRVLRLPVLMSAPWIVAGAIPMLLGLYLEAWGTYVFWKFGGGTPNPQAPPTLLVVKGPYALSRNPLYLGRLLILVGLALLAGSVGTLLLSLVLFSGLDLVLIPREERRLKTKFGGRYSEYMANVARWVPRPDGSGRRRKKRSLFR